MINSSAPLRFYMHFAKRYSMLYFIGFIALCICDIAQVYIPIYFGKMIDHIANGSIETSMIKHFFIVIMGLALISVVGRLGWRIFLSGSSRRIVANIRQQLFGHFMRLDGSFYQKHEIGDLMSRCNSDLTSIRMLGAMGVVTVVDGVFYLSLILYQLFRMNSSLAFFLLIPFPILTLFIIFVVRHVGPLFLQIQQSIGKVSQHVQEVFTGIRVVKTFVKEDYFSQRFHQANMRLQQQNMKVTMLWTAMSMIILLLSGVTQMILLNYGGRAVIYQSLSIGEFSAALAMLGMLIWPFISIGWAMRLIKRGIMSLGRISEIMAEEPQIQSGPNALKKVPSRGEFKLVQLSYSYQKPLKTISNKKDAPPKEEDATESKPFSLKGISFELKAGETLGILGPTGSGKTTLLKALCSAIPVEAGQIFIDGCDLNSYELQSYRQGLGLIPQDGFLFSASIRENILFACDELREEEETALLERVCEISGLSRDMDLFPQGLATQIGERGLSLSGGQKQRVSIARALAAASPILIMDDALSAVDAETEALILEQLFTYRRGKTNIFVSNRISTLALADKVLVLKDGAVEQLASPAELLREEHGFYREIYELQQRS